MACFASLMELSSQRYPVKIQKVFKFFLFLKENNYL